MTTETRIPSPLNYHSIQQRIFTESKPEIALWKTQIQAAANSLPGWKSIILQKAEDELAGKHILPGTDGLPFFVGNPPEWNEQPVTDKEYLWCLNRMEHWNDFILAYYLTGDIRYAEKIKQEAIDWITKCPPPPLTQDPAEAEHLFSGVSPWRTLEVGIRMFETWPNAVKFLTHEGLMDTALLKSFAESFRQHGDVLYHISPLLWPNANHNHSLMENLGLFDITGLFPELKEAAIWEPHASLQLERCLNNQLTDEGAQIEGCPSYHNLCMCYFCLWLAEARRRKKCIREDIKNRIQKGLDYSLAAFRPGGGSVPFGDSDTDYGAVRAAVLGYRVFDDPHWLILLQKLSDPQKFLNEAASCVLEWGATPILDTVNHMLDTAGSLPLRLSIQPQIQQVSYRTSWEKDALHIQFGCRMPRNNGHSHIDPQGFDFSALGRPMLSDPGRYTYDEAKERRLFKSAEMHNCLLINHQDPYEYLSSWRFGPQHDGCIWKAEEKESYFWTQGIHTCYFPAIHDRLLSIIDKRFLLIWDQISHIQNSCTVSIYLHVNQEQVFAEEDTNAYFTQNEEQKNLYLYPLSPMSSQILPGMLSDQIDEMHPSSRIVYEDHPTSGQKRYAILAIPFETSRPVIRFEKADTNHILVFSINNIWYEAFWNVEDFSVKHI